ncbi:hypothetical protein EC973_004224 [Apophysomyces ossiformis]|uniref:HSF-type DNA-binding domain-containing protein n=1 Tax=Apophysomyces ossiformis TaxID=679940 RepID=A0A8H7EUX4_9FUNG|nr:hypothetical protein EC973_004224 [Apophysomyces ossiformis]
MNTNVGNDDSDGMNSDRHWPRYTKKNLETSHRYRYSSYIKEKGKSKAYSDTSAEEESSTTTTRFHTTGRKSRSPTRTQAVFINKLYMMLQDNSIRHLIYWSNDGEQFSVSNPTIFSKSVLPRYFKHNKWQSFVRQLNMYGFHKVNDIVHSNLSSENETWEFKHPVFRQGAVEQLHTIKRKSTKAQHQSSRCLSLDQDQTESGDDANESVYNHIARLENQLWEVSKAYDLLCNEVGTLKVTIAQQQDLSSLLSLLTSSHPKLRNKAITRKNNLIQQSSAGRETLVSCSMLLLPPSVLIAGQMQFNNGFPQCRICKQQCKQMRTGDYTT